MRHILFIILMLYSSPCASKVYIDFPIISNVPNSLGHKAICEKKVRIAIIDTGFGFGLNGLEGTNLCKYGHKNFVNNDNTYEFGTKDAVPVDHNGHGTNIAGIINAYAKTTNNNFCLIIIKYYSENDMNSSLKNTIKAINYANKIGADIINYSSGGPDSSRSEIKAVKAFLNRGGIFVAAAGNLGQDLQIHPYYPAQDDKRVVVVANGINSNNRDKTSNYGERVNFWENGDNVMVYGYDLSGTSQSTAIVTGKIVASKNKLCK